MRPSSHSLAVLLEIIKPDRPHDCQWAAVGAIYAVNKAARVVGLHALEFVIATFFEPHRSAKIYIGTDGTRPCIKIVSSAVAGAGGTDGTRPYWHSVFGLCTCRKMISFLKLRLQVVKHRRKVNGLIKLERNMWVADKADQLDAAFLVETCMICTNS